MGTGARNCGIESRRDGRRRERSVHLFDEDEPGSVILGVAAGEEGFARAEGFGDFADGFALAEQFHLDVFRVHVPDGDRKFGAHLQLRRGILCHGKFLLRHLEIIFPFEMYITPSIIPLGVIIRLLFILRLQFIFDGMKIVKISFNIVVLTIFNLNRKF